VIDACIVFCDLDAQPTIEGRYDRPGALFHFRPGVGVAVSIDFGETFRVDNRPAPRCLTDAFARADAMIGELAAEVDKASARRQRTAPARHDRPDHAAALRACIVDPWRVVRALGLDRGARPQRGGAMIRCPWHDDRSASCSVRLGKEQTIAAHCFGCGDVFALIGIAEGLDTRRDFRRVIARAAELAGRHDIVDAIAGRRSA